MVDLPRDEEDPPPPERVTKMVAARRQLATAITLWFARGDAISIYTLSHAAYEVIHNLTAPTRSLTLLFDVPLVDESYRKQLKDWLVGPANHFKHAGRERKEPKEIEFYPQVADVFIISAIRGVITSKATLDMEEMAFLEYTYLHRPEIAPKAWHKYFFETLPVGVLEGIRMLTRMEFFESYKEMFLRPNKTG